MNWMGGVTECGIHWVDLWENQADWSQETFGKDTERGPIGALKHLEKEAKEAQNNPTDRTEYADCLLLIIDAARRAGIKPLDLIMEAEAKLKINKTRVWEKPTTDEPVEHIR